MLAAETALTLAYLFPELPPCRKLGRAGRHAVAAGMESMSGAPYLLPKARFGYRMGDAKALDAMVHDGLTNPFTDKQMINEASDVSNELEISRVDMDRFAERSHRLAAEATDAGRLAAINATCAVWEGFAATLDNIAGWLARFDAHADKIRQLEERFSNPPIDCGQPVLDLPRFGCINVHGSLLPRHRGASPIAGAILAGDREAGVTIMKMDAGVDTGPMLSSAAIPVSTHDTTGSLTERLARLGADLLVQTLPQWLRGEIQPSPQPGDGATFAPRIAKEDGRIDWHEPAVLIGRRVRAYQPWPSAFTTWDGQLLKVIAARVEARRFVRFT